MSGMSPTSTLNSVLDPLSECLDGESARCFIELRISPSVEARMDTLVERANEGLLTGDERDEYEALVNALDFISIIKLKARTRLTSNRK
jgi:hypothetical protein